MKEPLVVSSWFGITIFLGLFLMIVTPLFSSNFIWMIWGLYSINGICIGIYGYELDEHKEQEDTP